MSPEQAYDELLSMFKTGWEVTGHAAHFEGLDLEKSVGQDPYARVWIRHSGGGQVSMGGVGNRMFERRGSIQIEIASPTGNGLSESYQLAKVAADVFEGKSSPGGIWFRNVRWRERGESGGFNHVLVTADFIYNDVK